MAAPSTHVFLCRVGNRVSVHGAATGVAVASVTKATHFVDSHSDYVALVDSLARTGGGSVSGSITTAAASSVGSASVAATVGSTATAN